MMHLAAALRRSAEIGGFIYPWEIVRLALNLEDRGEHNAETWEVNSQGVILVLREDGERPYLCYPPLYARPTGRMHSDGRIFKLEPGRVIQVDSQWDTWRCAANPLAEYLPQPRMGA